MELSDLQPKAVEFETCCLELTFRPFTIADDIQAQELCGGQAEQIKAFQEFNFEKISLVAWYQLDLKSQQKVLDSVEGERINPETGIKEKVNLKPIEKFRALFLGLEGQISILTNLVKTKGINIPSFDDEEELKKWVDQAEIAAGLTGPKPTT